MATLASPIPVAFEGHQIRLRRPSGGAAERLVIIDDQNPLGHGVGS
jgi:hypothetical protein